LLKVIHSIRQSETRLSEFRAKPGEDALGGDSKGAVEGASAGASVAASAEVFGDLGYIEFTLAADAEAKLAGIVDFAKEDGGLDSFDADVIVDDAFAVLGFGADAVHVLAGDPAPG
jgi:hypothetical protein